MLLPEVIAFNLAVLPGKVPPQRVREMAQRAVPGLYAGIAAQNYDYRNARDDTIIACPSARKMTVRQAQEMLEICLG